MVPTGSRSLSIVGNMWFWTKGRCFIWRFFKIRGTLNHKADFPQEIPSLRASSATNCVWLLQSSLPTGLSSLLSGFALHTSIQQSPDPTHLSQSSWAPRDTDLYTANFHQWFELNSSAFSQNSQELSYTNIFRRFGTIRPETSYY